MSKPFTFIYLLLQYICLYIYITACSGPWIWLVKQHSIYTGTIDCITPLVCACFRKHVSLCILSFLFIAFIIYVHFVFLLLFLVFISHILKCTIMLCIYFVLFALYLTVTKYNFKKCQSVYRYSSRWRGVTVTSLNHSFKGFIQKH